jgi:hypothetical protein
MGKKKQRGRGGSRPRAGGASHHRRRRVRRPRARVYPPPPPCGCWRCRGEREKGKGLGFAGLQADWGMFCSSSNTGQSSDQVQWLRSLKSNRRLVGQFEPRREAPMGQIGGPTVGCWAKGLGGHGRSDRGPFSLVGRMQRTSQCDL